MNKKSQKNWIIGIIILLAVSIFTIPYFLMVFQENQILWNNFKVIAKYGYGEGQLSGNCYSTVQPITDTNGQISLKSTSQGGCGGSGGSLKLVVPNPKQYKRVYLTFSGNTFAGGSISSNCASSSVSSSLNNLPLFSISSSCDNSKSTPTTLLLNVEDGFVNMPGIGQSYKLVGDEDLNFVFSVSTSANDLGRTGRAEFNLLTIETELQPVIPQCQQLQGQLCNLQESKIVSYSTDCERDNLLKQGTYVTNLDQCQSYCQNENGKLCKPDTFTMFTIVEYSNVCEKDDLLSQGYITDLSKCDTILPPPRDNKTLYIVGGSILSLSVLGFMFRKRLGRILK